MGKSTLYAYDDRSHLIAVTGALNQITSQIQNPGINPSLLVNHAYNPIQRRYQYDPAGELTRTFDKLRGEIKYEYEANGRLHSRDTGRLVDSEEFRSSDTTLRQTASTLIPASLIRSKTTESSNGVIRNMPTTLGGT